jgi:hypothetical protein
MGKSPITVVREGLKAYADRGVFRNFREDEGKDGKIKFGFLLFDEDPVNLEFTEKDHTLVIRNMLVRVPAHMYSDLQDFLKNLFNSDLPPHRRIDGSSADVHFVKRGGKVSLVFQVKRNRYKYGVETLINLASWIRFHLQQQHTEYFWDVGETTEG